jgi:hypothetical protein
MGLVISKIYLNVTENATEAEMVSEVCEIPECEANEGPLHCQGTGNDVRRIYLHESHY